MKAPEVWGIDGDVVAYAVGFKSNDDTLEEALAAARASLQVIINACGDEGIVYLTDSGSNFRIAEACEAFPYKGHRKDAEKPVHLEAIRQYMIDEFDAQLQVGQEADDALAIGAVQHGHGIATIDKDLDGVPGWHYNWNKNTIYHVTEEEADRFFYTQMLTGDATDNIPGLKKRTGKVATAKIKAGLADLTTPAEMYAYVKEAYMNAVKVTVMSSDESDVSRWLLSQGRCLWMRREEGQLWDAP
jgi:hypothetical protein